MKKSKRKIKKRSILILIMMVLCIFSSAFFVYSLSLLSGIETMIRVTLSFIILFLCICFTLTYFKEIGRASCRERV